VWKEFAQWIQHKRQVSDISPFPFAAGAGSNSKEEEGGFVEDSSSRHDDVRRGRRVRPVVLIAHNAKFDISFLKQELVRSTSSSSLQDLGVVSYVDTVSLLRRVWWPSVARGSSLKQMKVSPPSFKQGIIYKHLHG
jgi:hypothetical protein